VEVGQEPRFAALAEAVGGCALFLLDATGQIATWNLGARHLVGWDAAEIVGRHFSALYTRADQAAGLPKQHLDAAIKRSTFEGDGWWARKQGDRRWTALVLIALRDSERRLLGFAVVARDAFADPDRLAKANEELVRADALRTQFLAATTHELAAPVTAIGGLARMLDESAGSLDTETQQRVVRALRLQAVGLDRRVRDLVTASSLDAGGTVPVRIEPVGVEEVIASVIAGFPDQVRDISWSCPAGLHASADGDRMHQILTNYLRNALRYGAAPFTVTATAVEGWVEIRVCDRGPG